MSPPNGRDATIHEAPAALDAYAQKPERVTAPSPCSVKLRGVSGAAGKNV
jgi:hypothetical protein